MSFPLILSQYPAEVLNLLITLRACARGKAISLSVCRYRRRHENRQISRCKHLSKMVSTIKLKKLA